MERRDWWRAVHGTPSPGPCIRTTVVAHIDDDPKNGSITFGEKLTHGELWSRAGTLGTWLCTTTTTTKKGDRVMLCCAPGMEFFIGFWACLRSGRVAVPVIPPSPSTMAKALATISKVASTAEIHLCLTDDTINTLRRTRGLFFTWPSELTWHSISKTKKNQGKPLPLIPGPSDLAFLQFTSGSTGDPKGVMVGHDNLWHNVADVILPFNCRGLESEVVKKRRVPKKLSMVSWLPPYHDLGLVYMHIAPLVHGDDMYYISPLEFLSDPLCWINAMSQTNASYSGGPDFAFQYTTRRFLQHKNPTKKILDLTSCCWMMSAAERLRPRTYEAFERTFRPYGFQAQIAAAYGLAETVVAGCVCAKLRPSRTRPDLLCCGFAFFDDGSRDGVRVKIVDSVTRREVSDEGIVGEIWLSSSSVARGYWGRPDLTEATFHGRLEDDSRRWLRTGDEGFLEGHGLFICGRQKDMIIVDGVNIYAEDVEATIVDAVSASDVRHGAIAAFADDVDDAESLVVVYEVRDQKKAQETSKAIAGAIFKGHGVRARVVAIEQRTIPRTTSGKIRRRGTRDALINGNLKVLHDSKEPTGTISSEDMSFLDRARAVMTTVPKDALATTWIDSRGKETSVQTFRDVWSLAATLQRRLRDQAQSGDRVLLCYAPGSSFLPTFLACLLSGIVAVPISPPDPSKLQIGLDKLQLIRDDCDAKLCCCDATVAMLRHTKGLFFSWPPGLTWWNTDLDLTGGFFQSTITSDVDISEDEKRNDMDLAFLQFTSGSTAAPKGVMISHGNLTHNISEIYVPSVVKSLGMTPGCRISGRHVELHGTTRPVTMVSWLPTFHDLGLMSSPVPKSSLNFYPPRLNFLFSDRLCRAFSKL